MNYYGNSYSHSVEPDDGPEWGYCQVEGCYCEAQPCYKAGNEYPNDADALLCHEHAIKSGFCGCCRTEAPLIEDGLCKGCIDRFAEEIGGVDLYDLPF